MSSLSSEKYLKERQKYVFTIFVHVKHKMEQCANSSNSALKCFSILGATAIIMLITS